MTLDLGKAEWISTRLGDVIRRSRAQVDPLAAGVQLYVGGGHIDTGAVHIERTGDVNDGHMGSTFRYTFAPGQVLFVSARPYLRKSGVASTHGVVADKTYVLDADPAGGLLQELLPFLLKSDRFVDYATRAATGSMNPRLLWGAMQQYQFELPPLAEQRKVSSLLWSVEEHARQLRHTLFDLVGVRATAIKILMSAATQTWEWTTLGAVATVVSGGTPDTKEPLNWDGDIPWVTPGDVTRDSLQVISSTGRRITEQGLGSSSAKLVPKDSVLVTTRATVGSVALAGCALATNQGIQSLVAGADTEPRFLMYWVERNRREFEMRASGSTFLEISGSKVRQIPILLPPIADQQRIAETLDRFDADLASVISESERLAALRSALLEDVFGDGR